MKLSTEGIARACASHPWRTVGAWIGCRKNGVTFRDFVDAAAPGVAIAQAMGRFGNWFNNEIYGAPTDLPWRLRIYEWDTGAGRAVVDAAGNPVVKGYFHPTFLYEALWCLLLAAFLIWIGRRFTLKPGQVFAAYVMGYPIGRIVIENMRTDSANLILGQRVNTWVSILVFLLGVYLWRHFGRMEQPPVPTAPDDPALAEGSDRPDHGDEQAEQGEQATEAGERPGADGPEDPSAETVADRPNDTADTASKVDRPAQS